VSTGDVFLKTIQFLFLDFSGGDGECAGDIERVFGADEGDFQEVVGLAERILRDSVFFIAEDKGKGRGEEEFGDGDGVVRGVEDD
jgi:hypothetical protein